jgi:hypothetical protein
MPLLKRLSIRDAGCSSEAPTLCRYFVYSYWSRGRPVYVGKGTGRRDRAHLAAFEAAHGLKVDRIHTHAQKLTEGQAWELEAKLIGRFGRKGRDARGTLLNACEGGPQSMRGWLNLYRP